MEEVLYLSRTEKRKQRKSKELIEGSFPGVKDMCFQMKRVKISAWYNGSKLSIDQDTQWNFRTLETKLLDPQRGKKKIYAGVHTCGYKNILRKGCGHFFLIHICYSFPLVISLLPLIPNYIIYNCFCIQLGDYFYTLLHFIFYFA